MTEPAHGLPATTRLGAMHLQVADLESSVGGYDRVLGPSVIARSRAWLPTHAGPR